MTMNPKFTVPVILLLTATSAAAASLRWDTDRPARYFVFRGKPIDPRCVAALVPTERGTPTQVELARCSRPGNVKIDQNYVSVEMPDHDTILRTPFASYEVVARNGTNYILSTLSSGGGSGSFSTLLEVHRDRDALVLEHFFTEIGDRCNGGLAGAIMTGNHLRWSVNITSSDTIELGGVKLPTGDSLEYGAQACVATADSELDLATGWKSRLVSETLTLRYFGGTSEARTGVLRDTPGWTERFKYQHCFNEYYNGFVKRGQTLLDPLAIKEFAQGFKRACVAKP